ncbi:MAG: HD-GYP domain-containing protein [Pseudomonadota bacterium]
MFDVSPFKNFMDGLSSVSGLKFDIRNRDGALQYRSGGLDAFSNDREMEALSGKILEQGIFHSMLQKDRPSMFGIPVMNGEGAAGSIIAMGGDGAKSDGRNMEFFLTQMVSLFEDKWRSQKELEKMSEEMTRGFENLYLYSRVATQIRTFTFTRDILEGLIGDLLGTMRTDLAFSILPERDEYNVKADKKGVFHDPAERDAFIHRLLGTISGKYKPSEECHFVVNDSRDTEDFRALHAEPFRFLAVKMQHKGIIYGWLGMASFNMNEIFRRSELSLLGWMAEQMAVVITNTDLYRDLERFVVNVVKSLVHAIEAKDIYTRGHSERVNTYCMMLANHLDMEERAKSDLHWASILHDIGKIGIPESILNKPASLTHEEYDIIKNHPRQGYDILRPIEQLEGSLQGILHHHQRMDGKGYPGGLAGDDIPLIARIISVADTFDAITSSRAYRDARSAEKAFTILEEVAGKQLDPVLVDTFKRVYGAGSGPDEKERHGG